MGIVSYKEPNKFYRSNTFESHTTEYMLLNVRMFIIYLWPSYAIWQAIIFFALWFLLLCLFFSSPNLSRSRLDVFHTSTHGVALVRISDAGLKRAARGSLKIQDAKKSPKSLAGHHRTTLLGYIFATKARIDNRKKNLLSSNMSSKCPPQYGELRLTSAH